MCKASAALVLTWPITLLLAPARHFQVYYRQLEFPANLYLYFSISLKAALHSWRAIKHFKRSY